MAGASSTLPIPTNPKLVKFIKGPDNTWTIQMEMHDNLMITALAKREPGVGREHRSQGRL